MPREEKAEQYKNKLIEKSRLLKIPTKKFAWFPKSKVLDVNHTRKRIWLETYYVSYPDSIVSTWLNIWDLSESIGLSYGYPEYSTPEFQDWLKTLE